MQTHPSSSEFLANYKEHLTKKKGCTFIKAAARNGHPPGEWIIGGKGTYKLTFI